MSEIDMDLGDDKEPSDFHAETAMSNIWSISDDDDENSGKKDKEAPDVNLEEKDKDKIDDDNGKHEPVIGDSLEEDLEKPSFLRRLSRRRKDSEDTSEEDK